MDNGTCSSNDAFYIADLLVSKVFPQHCLRDCFFFDLLHSIARLIELFSAFHVRHYQPIHLVSLIRNPYHNADL